MLEGDGCEANHNTNQSIMKGCCDSEATEEGKEPDKVEKILTVTQNNIDGSTIAAVPLESQNLLDN